MDQTNLQRMQWQRVINSRATSVTLVDSHTGHVGHLSAIGD
jgi:hypothetical protein